ncbi:MAG: septum formation initiator family protein [Candidatus Moranbacteria bacterium]|jgi:cell division protein FtsB|nr:septum formation initiator family protein [Candidatus Moranbacteria bacterium]
MAVRKYWIRVGVVGLVGVVSWVVYISSKQLTRNERIANEVGMLQSEADKIRRENETLGEKITYFSSTGFREQEAKEKLGMKKEGEEVVVIKERPSTNEGVGAEMQQPLLRTEESILPNYVKWWRLFFGD